MTFFFFLLVVSELCINYTLSNNVTLHVEAMYFFTYRVKMTLLKFILRCIVIAFVIYLFKVELKATIYKNL